MSKKTIKSLIIIIVILFILAAGTWYFLNKREEISNKINLNSSATSTASSTATSIASSTRQKIDMAVYKDVVGVPLTVGEKVDAGLYHLAIYSKVGEKDGKAILRFEGMAAPQPLKFEEMTDQEKTARGLATSTKVQVLLRNAKGDPVQYRVMQNDSDVVKNY
jgi:hypothetical protein